MVWVRLYITKDKLWGSVQGQSKNFGLTRFVVQGKNRHNNKMHLLGGMNLWLNEDFQRLSNAEPLITASTYR